MKRKTLTLVVFLGALAIIGISITQIYWVRKAFDLKEKQFNHNVHLALNTVADEILKANNNTSLLINPVKELSPNYYVVAVNDVIDGNLLEILLKSEFSKRNLSADFEYGIYDCLTEKMIYGKYVNMADDPTPKSKVTRLPKWEKDNYYFGVYFPDKDGNLVTQMDIWAFSTLVLMMVIFFFAYAVFVILKQKRLSEVQKDFINNMTHEFKTPISTITISSEVLKDPAILKYPERLINYATIIQDEANRLKNQVERVLQIAKIDKDEIALKTETIDVHAVLQKSLEQLQISSDNRVILSSSFTARDFHIEADPVHFTNLIYNLLDNAVKYSGVKPEILLTTENAKNGIAISIKDNGIGIAKEYHKKIFDKFYRVPTGNIHDIKGFGLGLYYVKTIVAVHRGSIKLESDIRQGTIVELFFPFKIN